MTGGPQIVRITGDLPDGFDDLLRSARAEGMGHLSRLADEWRGESSISAPGECLLAALVGGELAGIGGVTVEPALPQARRMRRFYVAPAMRRTGVGRTLAGALMQEALAVTETLTVHTERPDGQAFWLAMGFRPDLQNGWTHRYGA